VIGYYDGNKLMYRRAHAEWIYTFIAGRVVQEDHATRNQGMAVRESARKGGPWGAGLTATKMAECRWLKPQLVGQFEFMEWTGDNHRRHSRFIGLREDKKPEKVRREL